MSRKTWSYGEQSPHGLPGHGGYTDVARALTEVTPDQPVTRQLVYVWWKRRQTTGFPDFKEVKTTNGETRELINIPEAVEWYRERITHRTVPRGGRA